MNKKPEKNKDIDKKEVKVEKPKVKKKVKIKKNMKGVTEPFSQVIYNFLQQNSVCASKTYCPLA